MISKKTLGRILEPPEVSFFLFGPRGTGKSTWLKNTYKHAITFNLLDEKLYQSYLADVGLFSSQLRTCKPGSLVIIDEVQRLPSLLNEVHLHMEERQLSFILCGSSARKLKKSGTNLLAGRALRRFMYPFVPEELGKQFHLDEVLRVGSLPIVWSSKNKAETLEAYTQMYLKEEIQAEALVRNLPGFSRFLPVAALFNGQTLNISSLSRDCGVARTTVEGYLKITEDTLLTFELPAYQGRLRVRERSHPKLYFADPGIPRALKKQFAKPSIEERGHLFEGWVAALLRAYGTYRNLFDEWYYWAPTKRSRIEVDFLLQVGDEFAAVEVKTKAQFSRQLCRGLRAITDLNGLRRRILLYLGDKRMKTEDGIDVLPLRDFLDVVESGNIFSE